MKQITIKGFAYCKPAQSYQYGDAQMTTKDQAIARFVEAVRLDRHDWEDWPKDSREAFIALQTPAPDCRTCEHMWIDIELGADESTSRCDSALCVNGDKYQPAPQVVLWRTE